MLASKYIYFEMRPVAVFLAFSWTKKIGRSIMNIGSCEGANQFSCMCRNMSIDQSAFMDVHVDEHICMCVCLRRCWCTPEAFHRQVINSVVSSPWCCCGWSPCGSGQVWGGGTLQCWWPGCSTHVSMPCTAAGEPGRHLSGEGPRRSPCPRGCCAPGGGGHTYIETDTYVRVIYINTGVIAHLQLWQST